MGRLVEKAKTEGIYVLDVESTGVDPFRDRLTGIALKVGKSYRWIPADGTSLSFSEALKALQPLLNDPDTIMVGWNLKFDVQMLWAAGLTVRNRICDAMIALYLLDENRYSYRLKDVAEEQGLEVSRYEQTQGLFGMDLGEYAINDVEVTWKLWRRFEKRMNKEKLEKLFWKVESPFVSVIAEMEYAGVCMDLAYLYEYRALCQQFQDEAEENAYKSARARFNILSPKQVSDIIYGHLGAPTPGLIQNKQKGWPTDDDALSPLKKKYPTAGYILEFRKWHKLIHTYLNTLIDKAERYDGRFRSEFNQTGTVIGRLASRKSSSGGLNLQNIPRPSYSCGCEEFKRTKQEHGKGKCPHIGPGVRRAFVAPEGKVLIVSDFAQMELRMMAHLSRDSEMLAVYNSDGTCDCETYKKSLAESGEGRCRHIDLHTKTAEDCRCPRNPYSKNINFGAIYRGGAKRLAAYSDDYTTAEMQAMLDNWFMTYSGVPRFHGSVEAMLKNRTNWVATTLMGRRRRLYEESLKNEYRAVTQGIQFMDSGSCADLVKLAMVWIYNERNKRAETDPRWKEVRLLLQVHDEIVAEAPEEIAGEVVILMKEKMEKTGTPLRCPMKADPGVGKNWVAAK